MSNNCIPNVMEKDFIAFLDAYFQGESFGAYEAANAFFKYYFETDLVLNNFKNLPGSIRFVSEKEREFDLKDNTVTIVKGEKEINHLGRMVQKYRLQKQGVNHELKQSANYW